MKNVSSYIKDHCNNNPIESIESDEKVEKIMKEIKFKNPRSAFTHFVLAEIEEFKRENKGEKIDIRDINQKTSKNGKI